MSGSSAELNLAQLDRTRAARINLIANYASITVAMLQGVVMVPLYLSRLGREGWGVWLATGNVVAWLSVIDPGLSPVIQQQVAEAAGANDRRRVEQLMGVSFLASLVMSAFVLTAGWILWMAVARHTPGGSSVGNLRLAYFLAVISAAMMLGYFLFSGVFIGLQTTGAMSFFYVGSGIAGVVTIAFGLVSGWGVVSLALGRCATAFVLLGAALLLTQRKLRKELGLKFAFSGEAVRELAVKIKYNVFARVIGVFASNLDSVALGWWLGPQEAVLLNVNRKAADLCGSAVERMGISFMPGLAHLHGSGDRQGHEASARVLFSGYGVALAIAAGGVLAFNRLFVSTWVGAENVGTLWLTAAIVAAMCASQISSVLSNIYLSTGKIGETARLGIVETILRVGLLAVGLKAGLGSLAVPSALIGGALVITLPYFLRRMPWVARGGLGGRGVLGVAAIAGISLMAALQSFGPGWANLALLGGGYCMVVVVVAAVVLPSLRRTVLNALAGRRALAPVRSAQTVVEGNDESELRGGPR